MIAIAFPFYYCFDPERYEITAKVLRHYRKVCDELDAVLVGVGSEQHLSRRLWEQHHPADCYFEYDQSVWADVPDQGGGYGLAHKFDAAVEACLTFGPSYVALVGSDDLLPASYFEAAAETGAGMVGPTGRTFLWDRPRGRFLSWDGRFTQDRWRNFEFSAGTFMWTASTLARVPHPYQSGPHEGHIVDRYQTLGVTVAAVEPDSYWMVKGARVLNSVALMERHNFRLEPVADDVRDGFLAYWGSL